MKLIYISNTRIPTNRAHGIQIMKTCEALANAGIDVTLLLPERNNPIKEDPFSFYHLNKNFSLQKVNSPDLVRYERLGFSIQYFIFSLLALLRGLREENVIFYSREEFPVWLLSFFKRQVFWEAHDGKWSFLTASTVKRCLGVVVISHGIKKYFVDKGIDKDKILVSPDAVDLNEFSANIDKNEARRRLGLPLDKKIILYTGHLFPRKGADVLAEAAESFNDDTIFVFVGGIKTDVVDFKNRHAQATKLLVLGEKLHSEIPDYLASADILVLPNSGKNSNSRLFTSPMKLFEYMASGRPIVASDLPSTREILNENNAVLVTPDEPSKLAKGIKSVLDNVALADRIVKQACIDVVKYSWENRAEGIINFIKEKL